MIAFVQGTISKIEESSVVIDTGALGYRVFTPITEELMRIGLGRPTLFHTYFSVREDAMQLYGFLHEEELELFKLLINVNGVGPKFAMGLIAALGSSKVMFAIAQGDHKTLTKAPGIGAKTAQRIVIDLKDKLKTSVEEQKGITLPELEAADEGAVDSSVIGDTILALEALGYPHQQAQQAVKKIPELQALVMQGDVQLMIREALKQLAVL